MSNIQIVEDTNTDVVDDEVNSQYVTFAVGDEAFGFTMQSVREIIRIPNTVDVPLTPSALVGLANLRGAVLPILDLRTILGLPAAEASEAQRVIVTDIGTPVGLIVDKVLQVMQADESLIDKNSHVTGSVDTALLDGVIKEHSGRAMTQLLNVAQIINHDFKQVLARATSQSSNVHAMHEFNEDEQDDDNQLVSFLLDNQEYAFDLMDVEEIVRMPERVSAVPKTAQHILGLIELRNRLLPLVDLRRLFALNETEVNDNTRILVVSIKQPNAPKAFVGLVVDQVREVLRVNSNVKDEVPSILQQDNNGEIEHVCRLEDGKRLVSVLSACALFNQSEIRQALEKANEQQENDVDNDLQNQTSDDDIAQLAVFHLNNQEFAVTIDDVQEITRIPEKLDRVPKTPEFIEGMVNLRGTVMPVIDMRTRFNIAKCEGSDRQRIIVMNVNNNRTGFIVDSVAQVIRIPQSQIEQSPHLSDDQSKVMGNVVNLKEEKRMIQVLNVPALLSEDEIENLLEEAA